MPHSARLVGPFLAILLGLASAAPASAQLRGIRYCEVLAVYLRGGAPVAEVWNTVGFSLCPEDEWEALDPIAIRDQLGALTVLLNGPRFFLADGAEAPPSDEVTTFGTLTMRLVATLRLPGLSPPGPYASLSVERDNVWIFRAGSEVYELLDAEGRVYVMQAYSLIVDHTLSEADLPALGSRLALPPGWTYRTRVLAEDLLVAAQDGVATVVQDELANTYQLAVTDPEPECGDGIDNDGDGAADFGEDFGCDTTADLSERSPSLECDDGVDNDGDGRSDYDPVTKADSPTYAAGSGDPGCVHPLGHEDPPCSDGLDNDGDGLFDWDGAGLGAADPECSEPADYSEGTGCGLGFELVFLLPALTAARRRRLR